MNLSCSEMLHQPFHEEKVKLFEPQPCRFKCNCSPEKIASTLFAKEQDTLQNIMQEQGKIVVDCEFCGKQYHFPRGDLEKIGLGMEPGQSSTCLH